MAVDISIAGRRFGHLITAYADAHGHKITCRCVCSRLIRVAVTHFCVWEPAAGRGAIVRELRAAGHAVIASDLIDYEFPLHFVGDFMSQTKAPAGCECILTNPPFKIIQPFIKHALDLSPRVIMLARLALLESDRRTEILEHRGLTAWACLPRSAADDEPGRLDRTQGQERGSRSPGSSGNAITAGIPPFTAFRTRPARGAPDQKLPNLKGRSQ